MVAGPSKGNPTLTQTVSHPRVLLPLASILSLSPFSPVDSCSVCLQPFFFFPIKVYKRLDPFHIYSKIYWKPFDFRSHGPLENIRLSSVYGEIFTVKGCPGSNFLPSPLPTFRHGWSSYFSLGTKTLLHSQQAA